MRVKQSEKLLLDNTEKHGKKQADISGKMSRKTFRKMTAKDNSLRASNANLKKQSGDNLIADFFYQSAKWDNYILL